jgi:hypothetical protein
MNKKTEILITPKLGMYGQPFGVVLKEKVFGYGDVLANNETGVQIRVQKEPEQLSQGVLYILQLVDANPNAFVTEEDFKEGNVLEKFYSAYGELSIKGTE